MAYQGDDQGRALSSVIWARVAEIRTDDVHGASYLAREALRAVAALGEESDGASRDELLARTRAVLDALAAARPEMAPIRVWIGRLRSEIERSAETATTTDGLRAAILAVTGLLIGQAERASRRAAENAASRLPPGSVVFTASDSGTVREAVRLARQVGRLRRLLVAASDDERGHRYGEGLAAAVGASGVPVEVVSDSDVAARVAGADLVWLGADTIYPDGAILNGGGGVALARAAKAQGKPVEIVAESAKLDEAASPTPTLVPEGMDYLPSNLIDRIVTEARGESHPPGGPLGPSPGISAGEGERGLREDVYPGDGEEVEPPEGFVPPLHAAVERGPEGAPGGEANPSVTDLVAAIAERLTARGEKLAVAESAAGGRIGDVLSDRPGSSAWLAGGILAYSNESKREIVGVPAEVLTESGTVSAEVARAMAEGARRLFGTTWGLGESGIAGPQTGRRSTKPAGLAYVAVVGPNGIDRVEEVRTGLNDRAENKPAFALMALRLFVSELEGRA